MRGASVVVIAVLTAVTACSSPPPAPPPPPPAPTSKAPDPRATLSAWVGGLCNLDSALSSELFQEQPHPVLDPTEADRRELLDNLNKTNALFTRARELSTRLDPAPTAAANELLTRYRQLLDKSAADTAGWVKTVSQLRLADLKTIGELSGLSAMVYQGDVSSMVTDAKKADPALKDAVATARSCWLYAN